jgi:HAE1 family hydrophobic/amphiphilic exporter-1
MRLSHRHRCRRCSNRVSAATAQLPAIVNQGGVTVQKKNPNLTLAVNLYSPDGSVDLVTLSNYAYLHLVDPLKRIPGVGDVQIFGERRYSMRVWLDPDKLAKLGVTAVDGRTRRRAEHQAAAGDRRPRRRLAPSSRCRSMPWAGQRSPTPTTS